MLWLPLSSHPAVFTPAQLCFLLILPSSTEGDGNTLWLKGKQVHKQVLLNPDLKCPAMKQHTLQLSTGAGRVCAVWVHKWWWIWNDFLFFTSQWKSPVYNSMPHWPFSIYEIHNVWNILLLLFCGNKINRFHTMSINARISIFLCQQQFPWVWLLLFKRTLWLNVVFCFFFFLWDENAH